MSAAAGLRQLLTVSAVLVTARLAGAAVAFLTQVVLARWLGAEELGVFVLATSLGGVLAICCGVGFAAITPRFVSEYRVNDQPELLLGFIRCSRRVLAVNSVALVGGVIAAALLVPGLVRPELVLPLVIGAATAPAIGVMKLTGSLANVWRRHFLSFLPDLLLRSVLLLGAVLVMAATMDRASASLVLGVHLAIVVAVMLAQAKLLWRIALVPKSTRPLGTHERLWRRAGLPLVVVILLSSFLIETDVLLLGPLLPPEDLAVFNMCFRLTAFISFGIFAVYQIVAPDLSDAFARRDHAGAQLAISRANLLCVGVGLLALLGVAILGDEVLVRVGPEFARGRLSLILLAAAQVVGAAFGPAAQLLTVGNQQNRCVLALSCGLVVLAVLNAILVPRHGVEGASLAVLIATSFWSSWLWIAARHHVGFDASILAPLLPLPRKPAA
jgi:O-antigen/teichoic acid export membrane protein